jgi:hypothetical protein
VDFVNRALMRRYDLGSQTNCAGVLNPSYKITAVSFKSKLRGSAR